MSEPAADSQLDATVKSRGSRGLMLDPTARIVFGEEGLHVVHRRGAFELRGKDVRRLHERLSRVLDGRFTREQLLASVGERAATVERYLDRLSETGVLSEGPPAQPLPAGFPAPRLGPQRLTVDGNAVDVNLGGTEHVTAGAKWLSFSSRSAVEQELLLDSATRPARAGRTWVICDRQVDARELERRAAIGRHLLAVELGRRDGAQVSVFELAADTLVLRRLAMADGVAAALSSLPEQLELVHMSEHDQLPVAVWAGDLPGIRRRTLAYGLDARELKAALIPGFLGRQALIERATVGTVRGRLSRLGERAELEVTVSPAESTNAAVATSRTACACELVGAWAARSVNGPARAVDLLGVAPPSIRVGVLQNMLRRRLKTLEARIDDRLSPLVALRLDGVGVARIGYEEALCETLLHALARHIGLGGEPAVACAPTLLSAEAVRRRLRTVLARLPIRLPAVTGRIRVFGSDLFFGIALDDDQRRRA